MRFRRRLALVAAAVLAQAAFPAHPALGAPPAAITVTVACAPASTAFTVRVQGTDFNPFTAVLVTFDAAAGGRPEGFDATTDGFGRFALTFQPQQRPAGAYLVRADDFREREATATATVDCGPGPTPTPTPTPTPQVFNPTLAFHPAITRRGFVVALSGAGFPPGAKVHLDWGDLRGRTVVTQLTADGGGAIAVNTFLVFGETPFGTDRVLATPVDPNAFTPATAPLLVVPGTVEPPGFRVRR
jgi:hypothetical protein